MNNDTSNFDIGTLLDFKPPKFFCEKCKALLYKIPWNREKKFLWCPICSVKYLPTDTYRLYNIDKYLEETGNSLNFEDPIKHGQQLAAIAYNFNKGGEYYPPMRALFEALKSA